MPGHEVNMHENLNYERSGRMAIEQTQWQKKAFIDKVSGKVSLFQFSKSVDFSFSCGCCEICSTIIFTTL